MTVPFSDTVGDGNLLKSPAALQKLFTDAGVKPGDTVVAYCHIGQQAQAPGELPIWRQGRPGTLPLPAPDATRSATACASSARRRAGRSARSAR